MKQTEMTLEISTETEIRDGMNAVERVAKRLFDVLAAAFGLLALSPVFLYVYLRLRRQAEVAQGVSNVTVTVTAGQK